MSLYVFEKSLKNCIWLNNPQLSQVLLSVFYIAVGWHYFTPVVIQHTREWMATTHVEMVIKDKSVVFQSCACLSNFLKHLMSHPEEFF